MSSLEPEGHLHELGNGAAIDNRWVEPHPRKYLEHGELERAVTSLEDLCGLDARLSFFVDHEGYENLILHPLVLPDTRVPWGGISSPRRYWTFEDPGLVSDSEERFGLTARIMNRPNPEADAHRVSFDTIREWRDRCGRCRIPHGGKEASIDVR